MEAPIGFAGLGLQESLIASLTALGYEEPTPIQRSAIPPLLEGKDLLGQAATGTGKTAAFALPLLQRVKHDGKTRALVLVPTRELAMQVAEAVHRYGKSFSTSVLAIYGGASMFTQIKALSRGVTVVVATPGRALDHLRRSTLKLDTVEMVVLDEADEMLDMGFAEDLEAILDATPKERQTALFSATLPPRIVAIAGRHLRDPVRIVIGREKLAPGTLPKVRQLAYVVSRAHKPAALGRVLDMESPSSAIVFCRTRNEVDELTETLSGRGYRAEALHGGLSQEQRDRVMKRFRAGATDLLVATDVAARGLDIEHVSHVVNYDVPSEPEAYVHRIGRTGRAGREGVAITLLEPREHRLLRNIEALTRQKIDVSSVPTVADLRSRRMELTRSSLRELILAGGLNETRDVVEALANEFDIMDVAAAAVKMAHAATTGDADEVEIPAIKAAPPTVRSAERPPTSARARTPGPPSASSTGPRGRAPASAPPAAAAARTRATGAAAPDGAPTGARKPAPKGAPRAAEWEVTRIFVGAGRDAGMRPADLVGAITGEAGVESRIIGAIQIGERYSLVEVPESLATDIIAALRASKIKGRKVLVRRDHDKE